MPTKNIEQIAEEYNSAYKKITGEDIPKFYRPPEGKFSLENLKTAQSLGYTTVFWSSAYVDWDPAKQPSEETAFARIKERTFPGAVFLLHSVSKTNADILDRQLTLWEEQGYSCRIYENLNSEIFNEQEQIHYQTHPVLLVEVRVVYEKIQNNRI